MNLYYDYPFFIWILIVNTAVTAVYAIISLFMRREKSRSFLLRCLMMLLCPVVGPLYVFLGWLFFLLFFHRPVNLEDVIFSKDQESLLVNAEEEKERNLVPIEDAMLINDKDDTRALFLDVIKRAPQKSLYSISLALDSEDSELSHYAAAIIQAELDKTRKTIQEQSDRIFALEEKLVARDRNNPVLQTEAGARFATNRHLAQEDRERPAAEEKTASGGVYADISPDLEASKDYSKHRFSALRQGLLARDGARAEEKTLLQELTEEMTISHELMERINDLLQQNLLTEYETSRYAETIDRVARIVEKRDVLSEREYEILVLREIAVGELERASEWSEKAFSCYPGSIETHSARIKLRYAQGDRTGFFAAIDEMKRTDLALNKEMLELVRFFQNGEGGAA